MQNQKSSQSLNAQAQAAGPVEIDAQMLHLVSGGAPKNTWDDPVLDAATASLDSDLDPAPKNTW